MIKLQIGDPTRPLRSGPPIASRRNVVLGLGLAFLSLGQAQLVSGSVRRVPQIYPTIQAALTAAAVNDSILISPGVYSENLSSGAKFVSLIGTGGAGSTVIDGSGLDHCLWLGDGGRLIGITFRNGATTGFGGGVIVLFGGTTRQLIVEDCIFSNNTAGIPDQGYGGGLYVDIGSASASVKRCFFTQNWAGLSGGGAYAYGGIFEDNVFSENYAWHSGGGMLGGQAVRRNLFIANTARNAGGGFASSVPVLEENTFVGNRHQNGSSAGAGIHISGGGIVRRNIVVNSGGPGNAGVGIYFRVCCGYPFQSELTCNNSWGNSGPNYSISGSADTTGSHNFSADPEFCNPAFADYTLSATSPCSGSNSNCGRVGAFGIGCQPISVEAVTWSRIKTLLR